MYEYKQIDTSPEGIKQCAHFLNKIFTRNFSYEYLNWLYAKNPAGKAIGFNAYHDNRIVSHFASLPITSRMYGEECKGVLSLNTLTHPEYQGKKLYDKVSNLTYDYLNEKGYNFIIGVANANITPIFVHKQNFQLVTPLDVKIGIGNITEKHSNYDDYEYKRLWTKDTLHWRLSNPSIKYKLVKKRSSHYTMAPDQKFGIGVLLGKYDTTILDENNLEKHRSMKPVHIWIGVDHNITWKSPFFVNFPNKLKPSPLNLVFKDFSGSNLRLDKKRILFNCIDFDAY